MIIKNIIAPLEINPNFVDTSLYSFIVDGGKNHSINKKMNRDNSISIGDNDSSNTLCDEQLPTEKDESDLLVTLSYLDGNEDIVECYGLYGGRLDHQILLLGDLYNYCKNKKTIFNIYSIHKLQCKVLPRGKHHISHRGLFSLLTIDDQKIDLKGKIKYKIDSEYTNKLKPFSSHGLSNESFGEFTLKCVSPMIIFFP